MTAEKLAAIGKEVSDELSRAMEKFPAHHSAHESFAILKEEVDELWAEVMRKDRSPGCMRKEAIQVAAMAIRFIHDVLDRDEA